MTEIVPSSDFKTNEGSVQITSNQRQITPNAESSVKQQPRKNTLHTKSISVRESTKGAEYW